MKFSKYVRAVTARMSVLFCAVVIALAIVALMIGYCLILFRDDGPEVMTKALVSVAILPLLLGIPMHYLLIRYARTLSFRTRKLEIKTTKDGLTHCLNQTAFRARVEAYLAAESGNPNRSAALLVLDADKFKLINDTHGHDIGDQVIKLVARTIKSKLRPFDVVGRIGGEEFGVLLHNADMHVTQVIAERIRAAVGAAELKTADGPIRVSISIGAVVFGMDTDYESLFRTADRKLYQAKSDGRDRVELHNRLPDTVAAA
ncbi:GGDEF domain-containing protein [Mariluticola halotolerans]|uniref:GGDEF domain-containing protein n=1 Tax=Mariluticola halotolerans TaxID=2909283 RepID=UPI0026E484B4|nr:GGDEF domain-containing protein [Mariluticola halotolerans]UJQ93787.1 GGDEF domain-containing protein [Mariluticola halotolerans]